jgi:hypothetical protein
MADQICLPLSPDPVNNIFNSAGFEFVTVMAMKYTSFRDMMCLANVY